MSTEQPRVLTSEQKAVVAAEDKSFVVRASAGTGKTTTLVARYLRLVTLDGLRPDQILTVTFTRKAAAEMKRRIVSALVAGGLRDEAQIAETGPIQTIHGFCERVLRECSVDAGLDPDFNILDETEASRRMKGAIQEAIASFVEMPLADELLERLAGKRNYMGNSPHSMLEDSIRDVVGRLRGSTAALADLKEIRQLWNRIGEMRSWRLRRRQCVRRWQAASRAFHLEFDFSKHTKLQKSKRRWHCPLQLPQTSPIVWRKSARNMRAA